MCATRKGTVGVAIRGGKKVVCNDIDPIMVSWKEEALSRGYQSLIALPLKKSGKVIGNFNFTPVRKTFDAEEVELLEKRLMSLLL
jgi:hypothetical protein